MLRKGGGFGCIPESANEQNGKRMAARDYIELTLLLLTALYFYRRGFRKGVAKTRKIWRAILEKSASVDSLPPLKPETAPQLPRALVRGPQAFFANSAIHGSFGKN